MPWRQAESAVEVVQAARAGGYQVVAVEQTEAAVDVGQFRPRYPVCLVLGSERASVSPAVLALADAAVTIPMRGMANSLNVATTAAIVLHTLVGSFERDYSLPGGVKRLGRTAIVMGMFCQRWSWQ